MDVCELRHSLGLRWQGACTWLQAEMQAFSIHVDSEQALQPRIQLDISELLVNSLVLLGIVS